MTYSAFEVPRQMIELKTTIKELKELLQEWHDLGYVSSGGFGGTLEARTIAALKSKVGDMG